MTDYIIDARAWIEYLDGSRIGNKVKAILESADNQIFTSAVTFSEVVSKTLRTGRNVATAIQAMSVLSRTLKIDQETAQRAGEFHAEMRLKIKDFGLADAFILAAALQLDARILTADQHFKDVKGAILLK